MQKKRFRKICALLLSVALMCGILPATVIADGDPDPNVTYVDVNYYRGGSTDTLPLTKTCEVINDDRAEVVLTDTGYTNGWYVINNTDYYTFDGRISVSGNVNLILANFAPYQPTGGISVNDGNSLTVYRGADGAVGLLGIYSLSNEYLGCAGIGGDSGYTNGNITICGGSSINACGNGGAGIGSGANATSSSIGTVRIDGGNVAGFTNDGSFAAGIGGGDGSVAAPVVINGGSVSGSAWRGQYAAGIGSGRNGVFNSVTIKGGVVIANGGFEAPGIGSGVIDSPVNNNAKISISYARVLSRAGQNSTEAKAFYSAKKGAGGDVYSGTLSVTSKEYGVIYADNNYGDDAHHPEFTKVTASEALNYKWVEVCACIHYDEDDNRICDECGLAICKTDVDAVHGSDNVAYLLKGEKLHKPEDPVADGYVFLGWKQYDLVNHVFLDEYDFDTPVNEDTFVVAVWEQVNMATMCSGNVVFGSGLELEFRMQFTDYILENHPNAKVVFTKKGKIVKTTKISEADKIDGENYYFRVPVDLAEYQEYVIVRCWMKMTKRSCWFIRMVLLHIRIMSACILLRSMSEMLSQLRIPQRE